MRPLPPKGRGRSGQPPPQPEVNHSFPHMSIADIIEDLALFEFPISDTDIKSPKPEVVKDVMMFFLRDFHGENIGIKLQRHDDCVDMLPYPQIHEESPQLLHYVRAVYEMFQDAQYYDFTLQDLYHPESKRFRWQLCALINLAKYRRERLDRYKVLEVQEQDIANQNSSLSEKTEKLRGAIELIEEKLESEQPLVDENKKIIPALAAELEQLHKKQIALTEETGMQKSSLGELKDKTRALEMKVLRVRDELADNRSRIVSSPDRTRREIADLRNQLDHGRAEVDDIKRRRAAQNTQVSALRAALGSVKPLVPLSEKCAAIRDKKIMAQRRDRELSDKDSRIQQATDAAKAAVAHQIRSVEAMKGRIARQKQHYDELQASMGEDEKRWRKEQENLQRFAVESQRKVAGLQQYIKQLVRETNESASGFAKEMEEIDKEHEMVVGGMDGYDEQLREGMALFVADDRQALEKLQSICD